MTESTRDAIISTFFTALERRDFAACTTAIADLQTLATAQAASDARAWATYCTGILHFETDQDFAKAAALFSQLLATPTEPALQGRVLIALGRVQDVQGLWSEAIATYRTAAVHFGELAQPLDQIRIWKNMAATYQKAFAQGAFGEAALEQGRQYCELALEALARMKSDAPALQWLENSLWNTLGTLYLSQGRWAETISVYERGLALVRMLDDQHAAAIYALNLGEVYQLQRRYAEAERSYQTALTLLAPFHSPQIEMDIYANLGALATDRGDYTQALNSYDLALRQIERVRQEISDAATRANFFATTVESYYAHALLSAVAASDLPRAFAYSEQARARQLRDQLEDAHATSVYADPPALTDVQQALDADAVILSYFTTGVIDDPQSRFRPQTNTIRHRFPPAKTLLFLITRTTAQLIEVPLSPNLLYPHWRGAITERYFLEPSLRRHFYQTLLAPVANMITAAQRIYLIPHGPLHQIPFQALPAAMPDSPFAQMAAVFHYVPSVTLLLQQDDAHAVTANKPRTLSCLALGYNGLETDPLRFAEAEAEQTAALLAGTALTGAVPKKSQLYKRASPSTILHLSCHGHFDSHAPDRSALHLGPTERLTVAEVLAGAPAALPYALVVLSACESGLNQVRRGDELLGFAQAFRHAGAHAVIATLWRVDERATYLLMEKFYRALREGDPVAVALRRAQRYLQMLTVADCPMQLRPTSGKPLASDECPFADPVYWAPFVLVT